MQGAYNEVEIAGELTFWIDTSLSEVSNCYMTLMTADGWELTSEILGSLIFHREQGGVEFGGVELDPEGASTEVTLHYELET